MKMGAEALDGSKAEESVVVLQVSRLTLRYDAGSISATSMFGGSGEPSASNPSSASSIWPTSRTYAPPINRA